jgi:biopolymer transport protein ExbD
MKFRVHHPTESHGMNLVPLIDVLFILLIFFIVTFAMARFETEVNISVPAAEKGTVSNRRVGELVVNIRADGTIVLNSQVLDEATLLGKFTDIAKLDRKRAIILRGDENVQYRHLFRVLDLCHRAGLYHVSFASREQTKP